MTEQQNQTNDLLNYLVKPVQELEKRCEKSFSLLDERLISLEDKANSALTANKHLVDRLEKLKVEPNKLENRISRLEGVAKHVEPLRQDMDASNVQLNDIENELAGIRLDYKRLFDDSKKKQDDLNEIRSRLSEADKSIHRLLAESDAFKRCLKEVQSAYALFNQDVTEGEKRVLKTIETRFQSAKDLASSAMNSISDLNRRSDQFEKALDRKMTEKIALSLERLEKKNEENGTQISSMSDKLSELIQAIDLMEGRVYRVEKIVETCEKRCDNFGSQIREIKAEIGG